MGFDPIAQDPIITDWQHPTANAAVTFTSQGARVLGVLYIAQGAGPHPTAILMHGIPGYERHFDLAQVLRRAGWNVLAFHYRGAWGSAGDFSFQHALEDVHAAIHFLRSEGFARANRVDPARLVLIGHSLGAFAALTAAIHDPGIRAVISLTLYDLGVVARLAHGPIPQAEGVRRFLEWTTPPLQGTSVESLMQELVSQGERWYLPPQAAALADRSLLFIDAARDSIAPAALHHSALLDALQKTQARDVTHITMDTDHAFTNARIALARAVVDWLDKRKATL